MLLLECWLWLCVFQLAGLSHLRLSGHPHHGHYPQMFQRRCHVLHGHPHLFPGLTVRMMGNLIGLPILGQTVRGMSVLIWPGMRGWRTWRS